MNVNTLVLVGAFKVSFWLSLLGSMGIILSAAFMLYLSRRVIFGTITRDDLRAILQAEGPAFVDVRVTKEENTYPMIAPGAAARDMVG